MKATLENDTVFVVQCSECDVHYRINKQFVDHQQGRGATAVQAANAFNRTKPDGLLEAIEAIGLLLDEGWTV